MKKKLMELEVDFIGEQRKLTAEEEKILTDYFRGQKNRTSSETVSGKANKAKKVDIS